MSSIAPVLTYYSINGMLKFVTNTKFVQAYHWLAYRSPIPCIKTKQLTIIFILILLSICKDNTSFVFKRLTGDVHV